jgi:L-amino acid N-acyltransferase YncA
VPSFTTMPSNISIRHAVASDAAAIADIYNEAIRTTTATFDTEPKTAEDRLQWLDAHDERHPVFVAQLDGQIAGWASLTKWSDRPAYDQTAETSFYVGEAFRGRGIGSALKERLIEEARRLGFHTLLARAAGESLASIHINESFGFRHIGTMKEVGFKFGRRLDVHVMQLMLAESDSDSSLESPVHQDSLPTRSADIGSTILESAITSFRANKRLADKAVAQLPDDKLHIALDANTNCIAVIMKHVAGNLASRWTDFLTTDGEKPWRHRDNEFVDTFSDREQLLSYWEAGWNCLFATLQSLGPSDLAKTVTIRGEPHLVPLAIHRSLAHCGYHVGQIVMISRILAGDNWNTITIPRGESGSYNQAVWDKGHDRT